MTPPARLAELLGALSITTDLADGYRPEQAIRSTVVAVTLARDAGLPDALLPDVYWTALLRFLGCTAFAHEETFYGAGDDIGLRRTMGALDGASPAIGQVLRGVGAGRPLPARARGARQHRAAEHGAAPPRGPVRCRPASRDDARFRRRRDHRAHRGLRPLRRQGLPGAHRGGALTGDPDRRRRRAGRAAHRPRRRRRRPRHGPRPRRRLVRSDGGSAWDAFLDAEPGAVAHLTPATLDRACDAFARYADLKSVWRLGHSPGVATLAADAGTAAGLDDDARTRLRRAGLLHDLGVVALPNYVWDKPGAHNAAETEQVRLHGYWTERVLSRTPLLADLAAVAGATHERPDGTGYPKGLPAAVLGQEARLLAAADAFHALGEDRPHRPARSSKEAAAVLADEAGAGRFDLAAVRAVLEAAGELDRSASKATAWPAGLSDREVEVLRLLARGGTNKDIGRALGITAKTAAHHVAHIYAKSP